MELKDLFIDILYTTKNPTIVKVESIFKSGNKIKKDCKEFKYDLTSSDLLSEFRMCNKIEINFYQKGLMSIFKKCKYGEISSYFSNISDDKFIVMNEQTRENLFKLKISLGNLIFDEDLEDDEIIVGSKIANCIINTETGEYYFDKSFIDILYLC